ncbi:MAG TPA: ArgE/DapE family deacylase [Gemmatimonadaceae bacterium]|nr:ArgE/DapE family deacylase [Gemmatimonadaceae bacterium]
MAIPRGDAIALARALVEIDSRNPTLAPDSPGERLCASFLADVLSDWGFAVQLFENGGRSNVVASIGPANAPALMLNGHLDVVGVEGMTHSPFSAELRDGRIYGRGSADMKGGLAAMCAAVTLGAGEHPAQRVLLTAVADEEYESLGTLALLDSNIRADAAIIGEPTRLAICTAHRGFAWFDITVRGRAAHGSRYDIGVDAITNAALLLAELDGLEQTRHVGLRHPLLGRGSLHASTIRGGSGISTYPDVCNLSVERRTLPGESADLALREILGACERIRGRRSEFDAEVTLTNAQLPSDVPVDSPVVQLLVRGLQAEGVAPMIEGLSAWTDAALLNAAGIPTVCFGPGDISLAHAAEEFVPVAEIEQATRVLTHIVREWCT